jgi:hypothetical protein
LFDYLTPQYQSDSLEVLEAVADVDQKVFDRVLQWLLQPVNFRLTASPPSSAAAATGAVVAVGARRTDADGAATTSGSAEAVIGATTEAVAGAAAVAAGFSSYSAMENVLTGLIEGLDELLIEAINAVEGGDEEE